MLSRSKAKGSKRKKEQRWYKMAMKIFSSHDVAYGGDITSCFKIDKPPVVTIFEAHMGICAPLIPENNAMISPNP